MSDSSSTTEYKDVVGHDGYRVGTDGVILSCWRRGTAGKTSEWKVMKPAIQKESGRPVLTLNGKYRYVCHVVLETFVGPCPDGMEACHENGNPADNRLSNLRWDTSKNNMKDRDRHGRTARGVRNANAKLTDEIVRAVRADAALDSSYGYKIRLSKKYNIPVTTIKKIVRRDSWEHVE